MQIYFRKINKALSDLPNKKEENLLLCYHNLWPSFFYGALQIEKKIQEMYGHTSIRFFEGEIKNNIFAGKINIAIKEWKKFFFNENEQPDLHVPLAICKLMEEGFTGTSCFIEVAPTLLTSYRILGIYPTNFTNGYQNSFLIEMLEFMDWHNKKFPERLPTSSQFLTSKNNNFYITSSRARTSGLFLRIAAAPNGLG
uniref:Uncharacterized protein n=1 Tax=Acrobeloides nanus TaxID=290746 RepID=A0A914CQT5_9BILA